MDQEEKAIELVKKYSCYFHGIEEDLIKDVVIHQDSKQCALIACDEIIKEGKHLGVHRFEYWSEVKKEIVKL